MMNEHGLRVFASGIVLHGDRRPRYLSGKDEMEILRGVERPFFKRGKVTGLSRASGRRFEMILASAANRFRSIMTVTYRAQAESWECDAERNARVVERTKRDLNRLLSALRDRLGAYVWVQEFQTRGVVHYHLLCEHAIEQGVATVRWLRAIGALDDRDAIRHGVQAEIVRVDRAASSYPGRYVGKLRQKALPEEVVAAGRWWGRSRGLQLEVLADAVALAKGEIVPRRVEVRVVRFARRFLCGLLGFRCRGGLVVDWSGRLERRTARVMAQIAPFNAAQLPARGAS